MRIKQALSVAAVALLPSLCVAQTTTPTPTPTVTPTPSRTPTKRPDGGPWTFLWNAPTAREGQAEGSLDPAKDLLMYKFKKDGTTKSSILSPGVGTPPPTTYTLNDTLPVGEYHFVVTAVDKAGLESGPSNEVVITVVPTPTKLATSTPTPKTPPDEPPNFRIRP